MIYQTLLLFLSNEKDQNHYGHNSWEWKYQVFFLHFVILRNVKNYHGLKLQTMLQWWDTGKISISVVLREDTRNMTIHHMHHLGANWKHVEPPYTSWGTHRRNKLPLPTITALKQHVEHTQTTESISSYFIPVDTTPHRPLFKWVKRHIIF